MMLSILVPAHNEGATLGGTLENLLALRCPCETEIVVACNGSTDDTAAVAASFSGRGVRVVESERAGMSWGKNLATQHARGSLYVFVDADTRLPPDALEEILRAVGEAPRVIGTMAGRPDRGGAVVRVCFWIANRVTKRNRVHAPGGVMIMHREVFEETGGFDEDLPQGTSSDFIMRARNTGAAYLFIDRVLATTSIRRFEKTGIIRQMLSWRKNHKNLASGHRERVVDHDYEAIR